jgi:hypothetical protein
MLIKNVRKVPIYVMAPFWIIIWQLFIIDVRGSLLTTST